MNPEEYQKLFNIEKEHWFYKGKRDIAKHWISKVFLKKALTSHLDVGAGSGLLVQELGKTCFSVGVEFSPVALQKGVKSCLVQSSILGLPFQNSTFDCVTCFDVLEHVDNDSLALSELVRVTRPGGFVLVGVPAFQILWSDWDVALQHKRRYCKKTLLTLLKGQPSLNVEKIFYTNALLFLPILIYRFLRTKMHFQSRLEDQIPAPWVNLVLEKNFVWPAKLGLSLLPFGTSLFVVLQKK